MSDTAAGCHPKGKTESMGIVLCAGCNALMVLSSGTYFFVARTDNVAGIRVMRDGAGAYYCDECLLRGPKKEIAAAATVVREDSERMTRYAEEARQEQDRTARQRGQR